MLLSTRISHNMLGLNIPCLYPHIPYMTCLYPLHGLLASPTWMAYIPNIMLASYMTCLHSPHDLLAFLIWLACIPHMTCLHSLYCVCILHIIFLHALHYAYITYMSCLHSPYVLLTSLNSCLHIPLHASIPQLMPASPRTCLHPRPMPVCIKIFLHFLKLVCIP